MPDRRGGGGGEGMSGERNHDWRSFGSE
jgi:hypothetical protein